MLVLIYNCGRKCKDCSVIIFLVYVFLTFPSSVLFVLSFDTGQLVSEHEVRMRIIHTQRATFDGAVYLRLYRLVAPPPHVDAAVETETATAAAVTPAAAAATPLGAIDLSSE